MKHMKDISNRKWGIVTGTMLLFFIAGIWLICDQWKEEEPHMEATPQNTYSDTMVIAVDSDYQPYSYTTIQGKPAGYDIELIYLLGNYMKKNVEVRMMPWVDAQAAVQRGEADVLMGLDYNVEFLQDYELSLPLYNDPFVAFGKQELSDIGVFYNKSIATLEESGSFAAFLTPYQLEDQTATYSSYSQAFQAVERGEKDYAIAMYSVGRRAIANLENSDMEAVGPVLAGNYLCIGTKKGNTALMEELNQAIIYLKQEGVVDQLGEKWLGRYVEVISISEFLKQNKTSLLLSAAFLSMLVALSYGYINHRLAKSAHLQNILTKRMLTYQQFLAEATMGLYESVFEVNVTKNCIEGESTHQYYDRLGLPYETPFDEALKVIAHTQIDKAYSQGYLATFSSANVLKAYKEGKHSLSYELLIKNMKGVYYWMRVTARIFYWNEDSSVRMITYRVNIDDEKRKEQNLEEKVKEDALTGLLNKVTTEKQIQDALSSKSDSAYAFLMLDIDNFKVVNDSFGHAFGDLAIIEFAKELKGSVRMIAGSIVGRIGGDEFTVFIPYESQIELEEMVAQYVQRLSRTISIDTKTCHITASIGVALYPIDGVSFEQLYQKADIALYQAKRNGKNDYMFYGSSEVAEDLNG